MLSIRQAAAVTLMLTAAGAAIASKQAQPVFNAPEDVAAIKALEHTLATELDIDKIMPIYADNAVVLDMFTPGIMRGKDEIRAGFAPQLAEIRSLTKQTPELTVATNGTYACALSQVAYKTQMKDGRSFDMNVRVLDGFRKIDGTWRLVHQHLSLPVDTATMTALPAAPIHTQPVTWSAHPLEAASTTPEKSAEEIREFMDVGGASVGLDKLMQYYGPGDDTVLYDAFSPKPLVGRKAIADFYAPMMGSYKAIDLKMPLFAAEGDGSMGLQIDTQEITLTLNDGRKQNVALRQSDCMRRVGGKWYSFMEMISYPVDPETMKATVSWGDKK